VTDLLSVQEASAFLRITGTADEVEIAEMVTSASSIIERRIGPVIMASYVETYDGGRPQIMLRHSPVVTITSVSEAWGFSTIYTLTPTVLDGTPTNLGNFGYSLDAKLGLLTRRTVGVASRFANGVQNVTVAYTAGYPTVPNDLKLAAKLLVQHFYMTQRGGSRRPGMGGDDAQPASHYDDMPSRVEQILDGYDNDGVA
jgi:hypothetical protein